VTSNLFLQPASIGAATDDTSVALARSPFASIRAQRRIRQSSEKWCFEPIRSDPRCEASVGHLGSAATRSLRGWGKKSESEEALPDTLLPSEEDDVVEFDELWSYVRCKQEQAWIWLALCRRTRQVIAYAIGDRSEDTCRQLWQRVPESYRRLHAYSDFWQAYQNVLPEEHHDAVGKDSGQTNHIERFNNTLRQRLSCLVRKTLSFSKSLAWHQLRIRLFLLRYNRERARICNREAL